MSKDTRGKGKRGTRDMLTGRPSASRAAERWRARRGGWMRERCTRIGMRDETGLCVSDGRRARLVPLVFVRGGDTTSP